MRVSNNTEWLFFHLWKKNPETNLPCLNLNIAETIIFRWAQPYFWYFTAKDGMIVRKTKEKILLQNIEESFISSVPKCEVIANTLTSIEDPALKSQEKIEFEYIQKPEFHNFIFQREKSHNVIIQKFVEPKNGQNALIKVAWTPQFCLFFRKTNTNDINNQKIPLANRLVTFEGSEHLSNSDSISSPILASELEQTCMNIVKHIHSVTSGNVQISKMVLYFKLDDKNRLWLLFCTGLKLREKLVSQKGGQQAKKKAERALSPIMALAPKKDSDVKKSKIPSQYLLEDQINQVSDKECLRCRKEDLLYDLKLKHVLDHEDKIIQGELENDLGPVEEESDEEEDKNTFVGGILTANLNVGKKNIPRLMKKLYPNLTEERYIKLKKNVSLMNMMVKLCESCYLRITEGLIENEEEKNAKKRQAKMKDLAKKAAETFAFSGLREEKRGSAYIGATGLDKAMRSIAAHIQGVFDGSFNFKSGSENPSEAGSKRGSKVIPNLLDPTASTKTKQQKFSFFSRLNPENQQANNQSHAEEENVKRESLPKIKPTAPVHQAIENREPQMPPNYYIRAGHITDMERIGTSPPDMRNGKSPYSYEASSKVWAQAKENKGSVSVEKLKRIQMPKAPNNERKLTTTNSTQGLLRTNESSGASRVHRTNYGSMMSTIQDLKKFLGQSLNDV